MGTATKRLEGGCGRRCARPSGRRGLHSAVDVRCGGDPMVVVGDEPPAGLSLRPASTVAC